MIQAALLVPIRDNDGKPFSRRTWSALEAQFGTVANGVTRRPDCEGVWTGPDGRTYRDRSREYMLGLESWRDVCKFIDLVDWVRETFRQEAVMATVASIPEIFGPRPP